METEVLLYSGGIDSFMAYQYLKIMGHNPQCIYFNLGHKYAKQEMNLMGTNSFCNVVSPVIASTSLQLGLLEKPDAYIPNRNLLAAIQAVGEFGATKVWIGGTASDRVNDNNAEVFDKLSNILSDMHGKQIVITSPFWTTHKHEVVADYYKNWNVHFTVNPAVKQMALIDNTFSCYHPIESTSVRYYSWNLTAEKRDAHNAVKYDTYSTECMKCPACFRKSVALLSANIFRSFDDATIANRYIHEAGMCDSLVFKNSGHDDMTPRYEATLEYGRMLRKFIEG